MADNGGAPFWGNQGKIAEPKRQSKFVVTSTRFGPIWIIKSAKKPSFEVTEITVPFVNHEFYYPGRVKWAETSFTIIDVIDPDSSAATFNMLGFSGYRYPTDMNTATMALTKQQSVAAFGGSLKIQQFNVAWDLNSDGFLKYEADLSNAVPPMQSALTIPQPVGVVEEWELINPWVKGVEFGELKYDGDATVDITVKVRYDWARLKTASAGFNGNKSNLIGKPGQSNG